MHALIQNNQITHVGALPRIWFDGDRWHDFRDDDGTYAADLGWLPVIHQPRPDDTATTTWDRADPALVDGLPVVGWTERPKTPEEVAAEAEQNARLDDLTERVSRIEAKLWPAPPDPIVADDPTVDDWAALGGIWPDQGLLREGGVIWRNVSGVPLTTPPSGFPGATSQWAHLFIVALAPEPEPPAPTVAAWSATAAYSVGNRCTKDGRVWECLVAHGPERQGTWAPGPATPTVWRDLGPA